MRIDLLDRDVAIGAAGHRGRRRIARVLPGEDDVVGGEGLAVVPFHALLQLPGHRLAVGGERAVLAARDRFGQDRPQVALGVPAGERLVEQARTILVLGADGEVRVQQGRPLPPQHLQQAAAAALGRLVGRPRLRHRHARQREKLIGKGGSQPHHRHTPHEGATRQCARLHLVQQTTQVTFVHGCLPSRCRSRSVPDAPAILQDACKADGNRPGRRRQRLTALSSSPVIRSGAVARGQCTERSLLQHLT